MNAQTAPQMLQSHPKASNASSPQGACLTAAMECAFVCTTCADACLNEEMIEKLVTCIRSDLDCADICTATAKVLSRLSDTDWSTVQAQVRACQAICTACAEECEKHASKHEHCKRCAESCRRCEQACKDLLAAAT